MSASPWGNRKTYAHTFLAAGKNSGGSLVFKRMPGAGNISAGGYRGANRSALKIESQVGPSVPNEMVKPDKQTGRNFIALVSVELPLRVEAKVAQYLGL